MEVEEVTEMAPLFAFSSMEWKNRLEVGEELFVDVDAVAGRQVTDFGVSMEG